MDINPSNVIVQEDFYNIVQCRKLAENLYVFGDNIVRRGTGGQAVIRYLSNVAGIATKKFPGVRYDDYFHDTEYDFTLFHEHYRDFMKIVTNSTCKTIVFPRSGLGNGLAKMNVYSPKLFATLSQLLYNDFSIILTDDGITK